MWPLFEVLVPFARPLFINLSGGTPPCVPRSAAATPFCSHTSATWVTTGELRGAVPCPSVPVFRAVPCRNVHRCVVRSWVGPSAWGRDLNTSCTRARPWYPCAARDGGFGNAPAGCSTQAKPPTSGHYALCRPIFPQPDPCLLPFALLCITAGYRDNAEARTAAYDHALRDMNDGALEPARLSRRVRRALKAVGLATTTGLVGQHMQPTPDPQQGLGLGELGVFCAFGSDI